MKTPSEKDRSGSRIRMYKMYKKHTSFWLHVFFLGYMILKSPVYQHFFHLLVPSHLASNGLRISVPKTCKFLGIQSANHHMDIANILSSRWNLYIFALHIYRQKNAECPNCEWINSKIVYTYIYIYSSR